MRIDVQFTHMERSEALEEFAIEKLEPILESMLNRESGHAQVWLVCDHSRHHQRGAPEYRCEVEVRYPPRKDVFVCKADEDIHAAIQEAAAALKSLLRSESKREIDEHRHGPRHVEFVEEPTA